MATESWNNLERMVESMIAKERTLSPTRIRELIGQLRVTPLTQVDDTEADLLARVLEERHGTTIQFGVVLEEPGFQPWLEDASVGIDFYYWSRYKRLLIEDKHFPHEVVNALQNDTDRILGLLQNPAKPGPWDRRGMVVGHVQSGKTANYTGLICKAADAGYRLIVVIAGVHNNLRNQTQKRIDEGFVGRDSARLLSKKEDRFIGVGLFDPQRRPITFTNSIRDFNKTTATGVGIPLDGLKEPAVFVIKKNPSTLKNLLEWLREHNTARSGGVIDLPMLVIDDEADNASINVAYGKEAVSRINGQIRDLLKTFGRSCYVGYTATPFANIFIDPDTVDEMKGHDLFPRHFIVGLDSPSNYFGPAKVFGEESDVVRTIDDNESLLPIQHEKDHSLQGVPDSLLSAIRAFILVRAIRLLRGQVNEHNSMLINASRFMAVHGEIRRAVQGALEDIQASVRLNASLTPSRALADPEIAELHEVWEQEFSHLEEQWEAVQAQLLASVAPIRVVEVNTKSQGALNYDDYAESGLNVIVVGGFSLSRGLTLEGLTVSYFLRNSAMYDTLMQMGRWFGYRPGYEDLCRVWMPEEAEGWYWHITESIEELRDELRLMAQTRATPEDFGLKVRAHPDTLMVTARNKMGAGERVAVRIGLKNRFIETSVLRNDAPSLEANRQAVRNLVQVLRAQKRNPEHAEPVSGGWLLRGIPVDVVKDFLIQFRNHPRSLLTETAPIVRYIESRSAIELAKWDLLIAGLERADTELCDSLFGIGFMCQRRTMGSKSDGNTLFITNKRRVASRGMEKVGLSLGEIETAEEQFSASNRSKTTNYPDHIYRKVRKRPLLIIHTLAVKKNDDSRVLAHDAPVVAWSASFPDFEGDEDAVEYVVTRTWLRENMPADSVEEELDIVED